MVHITHWGEGEEAVLRYLARYVFRVAISNSRIVALDRRTVTFRYKERKSARWRTCQLDGHEFMRRFLQHVLPDRFHKVRYFGLWHPSQRPRAARARQLLELQRPVASAPPSAPEHKERGTQHKNEAQPVAPRICPCCGRGRLIYLRRLLAKDALGP